jgi:hypothetical protein
MKGCCKEAMENKPPLQKEESKKGLVKWLKRLGVAGFLFFLVKGLVWIAIFYWGARISGCEG